jgi:hypothetical protein
VALFSKSMTPNGNGFQIAAFILTHSHHRAPFKFIAHIRTTYTSVREFAPGSSAPLVSYLEQHEQERWCCGSALQHASFA